MKPRNVAFPGDLKLACVCGLVSLPCHYVFWTSLFEWARDRPSIPMTAFLVVVGAGFAAITLTYVAFALATARLRTRNLHLPSAGLCVAAAFFLVNAKFQFEMGNIVWGIESIAVAAGAFLLAWKRGRQD